MSDGSWVISVYLDSETTPEGVEEWHDRIGNLCRCRRHWWQFWNKRRFCEFDVITSHWEPFDD